MEEKTITDLTQVKELYKNYEKSMHDYLIYPTKNK